MRSLQKAEAYLEPERASTRRFLWIYLIAYFFALLTEIFNSALHKYFLKHLHSILITMPCNKDICFKLYMQKQPSRAVPRKRCSENMQQIYRRTPMPKWDFKKVAQKLYWNHISAWVFSCKLLLIFRTTFLKNTSRGLLLYMRANELT